MKYIFLVLCLPLAGYAQQDTAYFNKKWEPVADKSAAVFFRPAPVQLGAVYRIRDYYINGQLQMDGYATTPDAAIYTDHCIYYDSLGNKKKEGDYENGMRTGLWQFYFYGTGKLRSKVFFHKDLAEGEVTVYDSLSDFVSCKGTSHEGLKVGTWYYYYPGTQSPELVCTYGENGRRTWYYPNGNVRREDVYVHNKRISGRCLDTAGNEEPYREEFNYSKVSGKLKRRFAKGLKEVISTSNVSGRGIYTFIVDKQGYVKQVSCLRSLNETLDRAFLRFLRNLPPFSKYKWDGKPVETEITMNITVKNQAIDELYFHTKIIKPTSENESAIRD